MTTLRLRKVAVLGRQQSASEEGAETWSFSGGPGNEMKICEGLLMVRFLMLYNVCIYYIRSVVCAYGKPKK